jgi:recombination associated protein RdgC
MRRYAKHLRSRGVGVGIYYRRRIPTAILRCHAHPLDTEEVRQNGQAGKLPTRLALTWNSRMSFVLTENLRLKKLAFLEVVFDNASTGKDDGFGADTAIATCELRKLFPDLVGALGGEMAAAE